MYIDSKETCFCRAVHDVWNDGLCGDPAVRETGFTTTGLSDRTHEATTALERDEPIRLIRSVRGKERG